MQYKNGGSVNVFPVLHLQCHLRVISRLNYFILFYDPWYHKSVDILYVKKIYFYDFLQGDFCQWYLGTLPLILKNWQNLWAPALLRIGKMWVSWAPIYMYIFLKPLYVFYGLIWFFFFCIWTNMGHRLGRLAKSWHLHHHKPPPPPLQ